MHCRKQSLAVEQVLGLCAVPDPAEARFVHLDFDRLVPVLQLRVESALPGFFRIVGAVSVAALGRAAPHAAEAR